ncbi:MAG: nicotinate-nucleotide adenylyltransferase [Rhodoferax sp.]|uniref:nicotinate-nucleotide adenylyltransferase n=1 Tax=Rhodoferax sp. TaxID=50421 RepID=UPI0026286225|nr:nicotinate-nucleotide adenylyltransferase [Rhodoferax sp.]MDD2879282.1 nicotinate-nucleotide adenylyltransferase [Rhodoferax sp.]
MPEAVTPRRVGVFGGAFDPPHLAHQALLQSAMEELALDELRVIPTGQAWHKTRTLTAPEHRLEMAQLAFSSLPKVVVDAQEIKRGGPSYTIDTLRGLAQLEPQAEFFLIMGADQAAALTTWRAWQEILQLAIICVADRTDSTRASTLLDAEKLFPARFFHLKMPALTISATQIRATISARQPVDTLVQDGVARYIADHHLYQSI